MIGQFQSYKVRSLRITTLWKSHAIPNFCDFDAHGTLASKEHLCDFFFKRGWFHVVLSNTHLVSL